MVKALKINDTYKYLLLCEGQDEKAIIELLLDTNKLIFDRTHLIGSVPYHARQLRHPTIINELEHYNKPVIVLRVGDKQNDILKIPSNLKNILSKNRIYKYCTKPELEILLVINEGLIDKFKKSKISVDTFAKENITYNGKHYDKSTEFLKEYYGGKRIDSLVSNLKEYKRTHKKHNKDEKYLADLLK